jgi:hypothetical protein
MRALFPLACGTDDVIIAGDPAIGMHVKILLTLRVIPYINKKKYRDQYRYLYYFFLYLLNGCLLKALRYKTFYGLD